MGYPFSINVNFIPPDSHLISAQTNYSLNVDGLTGFVDDRRSFKNNNIAKTVSFFFNVPNLIISGDFENTDTAGCSVHR